MQENLNLHRWKKLITPKLKDYYTDFAEVEKTDAYRVFQAKSIIHQEIHTIRVFDVDYGKHPDLAAQRFIQELLHLCCLHPQSVFVETFEIKNKNMTVATKPLLPLHYHLNNLSLSKSNNLPMLNIEKFIMNLTSEIKFLKEKMKLSDCSRLLDAENIFFERRMKVI